MTKTAQGTYTSTTGEWVFNGEIKEKSFSAKSVLTWKKEGVSYKFDGVFVNGRFHGKGVLTQDTTTVEGNWDNGVFVGKSEPGAPKPSDLTTEASPKSTTNVPELPTKQVSQDSDSKNLTPTKEKSSAPNVAYKSPRGMKESVYGDAETEKLEIERL